MAVQLITKLCIYFLAFIKVWNDFGFWFCLRGTKINMEHEMSDARERGHT